MQAEPTIETFFEQLIQIDHRLVIDMFVEKWHVLMPLVSS